MSKQSNQQDSRALVIQRQLQPLFSASAAIVVLRDEEVGELEMPELRHRIIFNPARRQSFIAGRVAARAALEHLGLEPEPIPVLESQAPQWPEGVVGSITHSKGYTAVVLERSHAVLGVGVDLQDLRDVRDGLLERIATTEEVVSVRQVCRNHPEVAPHLAFAIKEAVFKALPSELQKGLTISQIQISVPSFGCFQVEGIAGELLKGQQVGRFALNQECVAAGFSLLAGEAS